MITKEIFRMQILLFSLQFEGGYSNVVGDKGGETYRGISRVYNPRWSGWAIIDSLQPLSKGDIINHVGLKQAVLDYYYEVYFSAPRLDLITSLLVSLNMFDWRMNGGYDCSKLQKMLKETYNQQILVDGLFGVKTIAAINACPEKMLCKDIIALRQAHFDQEIIEDPTQEKFYKGWCNRLNSLKQMLKG